VSHHRLAIGTLALLAAASTALAQPAAPAAGAAAPAARPAGPPPAVRPALLFKEEWKQNDKGEEKPVNLVASLRNPDLELKLYGPGAALDIAGKDGDENNPSHLWSGDCKSACAFTLRSKNTAADLTGLARIRINSKMSGFHKVYPIVKLVSGDWYIGDRAEGPSTHDWAVSDIALGDLRWTKLDIANVVTKGNPVDKIDLGKVDEIGFADLMPGSGHGPGGWFDLAQVEVYAKPAAR
jgi:hypothetical protein